MRNKNTLLSLLIFAMALILSSCSGEISTSTHSVETKDSYEKMKTESKNSMSMFGTVKSIVELDFSMSRGPDVTNINDEENDLISTYHIVYYDSISDSISAILNSVPKEEFHIPGIKNKIDSSANYAVLFRSFYFKGKDKATPAYRKVYLMDRESIDKHNNVMMQLITCSPDFVYDIDNQLEISTGEPAKYDWESGNTEDADHFVIDDVTSFGSIDSLIEKKWILVDSAGEPVKRRHSDASYVLKLTKQNAFSFFPFDKYESGSFSSEGLRIKNHIYSEADIHNYAFLVVDRYPENYRFVWEIKCYWYSEGKWHYSNFFQTEEDMIPIVYVDVTESKNLSFYTEAKAIGTITRIYQAYKGTAPYLEYSKLESFVVEYSKAHDNLRTVIENDRGKALSGGYSNAGRLQDSTVAYANILHNVDTNELSAAIMVVDSYTSYIYLTLEMFGEELAIENKLLSSLDSIYYETKTGKFRDKSRYDGSLYYSEYEHADELVATLKQLGTITDVIYFTGKTGQTKPHKNIFPDSPSYYVAIAAQFSSFNQDYLESNSTSTRPQNPYFTVHSKSFLYDFDYQKPGTVTAELDVFFNEDGSVSEVQVRKVTNPEAMDTRNYATTYVMNDSFILTSEDVIIN